MNKFSWLPKSIVWLARKRLLGGSVLLFFVLAASLIVVTGPKAEPTARQEKAWPVSVVLAKPETLKPTIVVFGRVESRQSSSLKTSISAVVDFVFHHEGEWVEKDELLLQLNAREQSLVVSRAMSEVKRQSAQLSSVKNEFELTAKVTDNQRALTAIAESKLNRHLDLYKNKMVSDAILDEAKQQANERRMALEKHLALLKDFPNKIAQQEAALEDAHASLDRALSDLEQTRIRAPFAGRIVSTSVSPGDRVSPFEPLISIANFDALEIRATVPNRIGNELRRQLMVGNTVGASGLLDGEKVTLLLDRVSGNVKSGQSGVDAFFVPEVAGNLNTGRVVDVKITLPAEKEVIALPLQAIYEGDRIYRVANNRLDVLEAQRVGDMLDDDGQYRILIRVPELQQGDQLVTTQLPRAITGLLVAPLAANEIDKTIANQHNM